MSVPGLYIKSNSFVCSSDKENVSEDEKQDHEDPEHDLSQEKDEGEGSDEVCKPKDNKFSKVL